MRVDGGGFELGKLGSSRCGICCMWSEVVLCKSVSVRRGGCEERGGGGVRRWGVEEMWV